MAIDITKVTTGAITGTGNFDKLMQVAKLHLFEEYKAQRITGDKYAEVYMAIMNQVLAQAIQFTVSAESTNQQLLSERAKVQDKLPELVGLTDAEGTVQGSIGKQKSVYDAQIKGFKDKSIQDATKAMMDIWTVQRSTDSGIQPNEKTNLYDSNIGSSVKVLFDQVGIPVKPV